MQLRSQTHGFHLFSRSAWKTQNILLSEKKKLFKKNKIIGTWICACIFFFSFWRIWFLSSSSSTLDSKSCRISSSSCFLAASLALISSASAKSSVSAWSCSARIFFSSKSCNHNKVSSAMTAPSAYTRTSHCDLNGQYTSPKQMKVKNISTSLAKLSQVCLAVAK